MKNEQLISHLHAMIKPLFPEKADLIPKMEGSDICFYIDWKLPEPETYSKQIKLVLNGDAVKDYIANPTDQNFFDLRIIKFIAAMLANFDARHDSPRYAPRPQIEWIIIPEILELEPMV